MTDRIDEFMQALLSLDRFLALSLIDICGLAIENARRYQKIADQKNELMQTLNELKETQSQLVEAEKMASLGNLVAGVAHEINTPVGVGITAASALLDKNNMLHALYKEKKMKRTDLRRFHPFHESDRKSHPEQFAADRPAGQKFSSRFR